MQINRTITRFYLILNKIKDSYYPSFKALQDMLLTHDIEISYRTLQRDIKSLRDEFGIEIEYNKLEDGYDINMEASSDYEYFIKFFEMTMMSGTLTDSLKDGKNIKSHISFDISDEMVGVEHINKLLFAIKNLQIIEIEYQKFTEDQTSQVVVLPGLLKEYQKRWYLIGIKKEVDEIRTYGLDRIKKINLTSVKFNEKRMKKIHGLFTNIIGISHPNEEKELIELAFSKQQSPYIKTLPLHQSQKITREDKNETIVILHVAHNKELEQKIMSFGKEVRIIKPLHLKEKIIANYKSFIKNNKQPS